MNSTKSIAIIRGISAERVPMTLQRKTALVSGILYLLTFVSIPTLSLYGPLHEQNYMISHGRDTGIITGNILEIVVALANIGTAVVLYPVLKKQNQGLALGFVGTRILEAATMFAGVAFLSTVVTLKQSGAGTEAMATSHALVTLYDRMFLIGQSFIPAVNDVLLGLLLFQSRLVPRGLSLIGIIGAPLLLTGDLLVLFGFIGQHGPITPVFAIPVAVFEFSLGIYLVVKGFKLPRAGMYS